MRITNDDLSRQAYRQVKRMIVSKKLAPGQKIVQEQLADKLGISRTPLRSALQMLEAESLIESIPRKGVIVREFDNTEIIEIYDCRVALEGTAVRLFAERATTQEVDKLESYFADFTPGNVDKDTYQKADMNFHDFIVKHCGNHFLSDLFRKGNLLVCIDLIGLVRPPEETLQEHRDILAAIRAKDGRLAETRMREHLDKSKELLANTGK